MARKQEFSAAEIANDPSLRWCPYRQWEALRSDVHGETLRFVRYEDGKVRLATLNGIRELPDLVGPLTVRRPSVLPDRWEVVGVRGAAGREWFAMNRGTGERVVCPSQDAAEAEAGRRTALAGTRRNK